MRTTTRSSDGSSASHHADPGAANSGVGDGSRNADRIAAQQEELDRLIKERDALVKK
jgi:hypothetical protein